MDGEYRNPAPDAPLELRLWRRGDDPDRETRVDLSGFTDDFELVAEAIEPGTCVVLQGVTHVPGLPGDRPGFVYDGEDGRRHALTVDPREIVLDGIETEPAPDTPETGVFLPDAGAPLAFGGAGQPTLYQLLSGSYVPPGSKTAICPDGSFQIVGDDVTPEVRDLAFTRPDDIDFPDCGGVITCLAPEATVLTDKDSRPAARLRPGDRVLTRHHGFQVVDWTGAPPRNPVSRMIYVATRTGVLRATDAPSGHFLILSRRLSNSRSAANN